VGVEPQDDQQGDGARREGRQDGGETDRPAPAARNQENQRQPGGGAQHQQRQQALAHNSSSARVSQIANATSRVITTARYICTWPPWMRARIRPLRAVPAAKESPALSSTRWSCQRA